MNASKQLFQGILPAVVTPFDENETFAERPYEALLARVFDAGSHGIYVCGQTGEGLLQTVEGRKRVAEASVCLTPPGKQVIVHVGAHRTADAIELARHASGLGVTAVSSLPPLGPYSFAEVRAYYQAIAAAAEVPVLVYYFPDLFPSVRDTEQILDLLTIPNVAGLKFTDFDLYRMRIVKQTGAVLFNGRDEVLAAGLMMGAGGGIGTFYNIMPEWFVDVYERSLRQDWAGAREVQDRINAVIRVVLRFPLFPAIKEVLRCMGIDCGPCIRPRQGLLTPAQSDELRRAIEGCGIELRHATRA
jgi:N-acetylneuraminate lyase